MLARSSSARARVPSAPWPPPAGRPQGLARRRAASRFSPRRRPRARLELVARQRQRRRARSVASASAASVSANLPPRSRVRRRTARAASERPAERAGAQARLAASPPASPVPVSGPGAPVRSRSRFQTSLARPVFQPLRGAKPTSLLRVSNRPRVTVGTNPVDDARASNSCRSLALAAPSCAPPAPPRPHPSGRRRGRQPARGRRTREGCPQRRRGRRVDRADLERELAGVRVPQTSEEGLDFFGGLLPLASGLPRTRHDGAAATRLCSCRRA